MIPAAVVQLAELPRSPNGKIARAALPAPDGSVLRSGRLAMPRNQTEERLAGIWANVLGLKELGIHDNFFDLGGHSLLGTQVILRVRDAFGVELPLRAIFQSGTVAGFSKLIEEAEASPSGCQRIEAVSRGPARASLDARI
jgi:acyl carrier protein